MINIFVIIGVVVAATLHLSETSPLRIQKRAAFYIANETACVVDNTVYFNGDPIPTDDPCEACKCRPPGFACVLKECEVKPGCRAVRRAGHCCPDYICGCEHNGRMYRDGDVIRDSQNPCYTCHCQGSSIACAFVDCFFRVDCAPEYVPGECCPQYNRCTSIGISNTTFIGDNVFPSTSDEQTSSEASHSSSVPQETEILLTVEPSEPTNIEIFRDEISNSESEEVDSSHSNSEEGDPEESTASNSTEGPEQELDKSEQTEKPDLLPATQPDSEIISSSEEQFTVVTTSVPEDTNVISEEQESNEESSLLNIDSEIKPEQVEQEGTENASSSTETSSAASPEEEIRNTSEESLTSVKTNEDLISTNNAADDQTITEQSIQTSAPDSSLSSTTDSTEFVDKEADHSKSLKIPNDENDSQDSRTEVAESQEKFDDSNSQNSNNDPIENLSTENASEEKQSEQSSTAEPKLTTEDSLITSSTGKELTEEADENKNEKVEAVEVKDILTLNSDQKENANEPEEVLTTNVKEASDEPANSNKTETINSTKADEPAEMLFKALNEAIESVVDQKLSSESSSLSSTSQATESSNSTEKSSEESSSQTTALAERKENSQTDKSDTTLQITSSSTENAKSEFTQSITIRETTEQKAAENITTMPSKEPTEDTKLITEAT
ncbi:von Willebrand factor C and EGF domain-containing protein, partial [Stegodyphus mimosarum]